MRKAIIRWVLIFLALLIVLIGIASGVAWHYKPELTAAIHQKIKENINGEFNIDNVSVSVIKDFPQVSVSLEGIFLRGLKYDLYKKDFLAARLVVVNVNLVKLLWKEVDVKSIRISDANVFIFTTKTGYSNLDIFKTKKSAAADTTRVESPDVLNIHTVYLNNVAISVQDSSKGKAFGFKFLKGKNEVVSTDSSRQFHFTGNIYFDGLQFNAAKGSFLLQQSPMAALNGEFFPGSHQLIVGPSELKFAKSTIHLSARFHFVPDGAFSLAISSENMNYVEGRSLLPKSLGDKLAHYEIGGPFFIDVGVKGKLSPGNDPSIDIQFKTTDTRLRVGKDEATDVFSQGSFTNHADTTKAFSDQNSKIDIASFKGNLYGLPLQVKASFNDLADPSLQLSATFQASGHDIQTELDSSVFRFRGGALTASISFTGKLVALLDPAKHGNAGVLKGRTEIKNMNMIWVPRNLTFSNLNAAISFKQNQIAIENVFLTVNKSPLTIKGTINGFSPWSKFSDQRGSVKLSLSSPDLNLTGILPEKPASHHENDNQQQLKTVSNVVDNIYKRLEFEIALNINHLRQHSFNATGITGKIVLRNNELEASPIRLKVAEGDVDVSFGLSQLNKPVNPVWVQASVHHADIKDFFQEFDNFNQHAIKSENLSGTIDANIGFNGLLDDDFNLMMPTLIGTVDLKVKNGKLTNFAPMEKMSNFLFKHRDFSDVEFAEIKSTFALKGTEISINRMEVESSVISLFIEGRYSMNDSTDLTIQLPLSNLKKRDKDYKPKNVGVDSKVGPSVYLRARTDGNGNIGITYDPFHKFRKK